MVPQSLKIVLDRLTQQKTWQESAQFQQLLLCWPTLVGAPVAAQTRPVRIDRQVLKVATSSAVWAQNLRFERHRILAKLNPQMNLTLTDIHFSTADWLRDSPPPCVDSLYQELLWQNHPCRVGSADFQPCPQCDSPTPEGELKRWQMCAFCVVKRWH